MRKNETDHPITPGTGAPGGSHSFFLRLAVDYRPLDDLEASGFDMFDPADFDPTVALASRRSEPGSRSTQARVHRTASAFLQWLDVERRPGAAGPTRELDTLAEDRGALPFLAHGYPAAMYDAPAHNLRGSAWMRWRATTWFVTLPARWNDQAWSADRDWLAEACPTLRIAAG